MIKMQTETFMYEEENGTIWELRAFATAKVDNSYGADADGRRGTRAIFIEDIIKNQYQKSGQDVKKEDVPEAIRKELDSQADNFDTWEEEEPDYPFGPEEER